MSSTKKTKSIMKKSIIFLVAMLCSMMTMSSYANSIDTNDKVSTAYDYQAKSIQVCQYIQSTGQTYGCETWYGTTFIYFNDENGVINIICPMNPQMESSYTLVFMEANTSGLFYVATGLPAGYSATFLFARNGIYQVLTTHDGSLMITYGFY